MAEEDLIYGKNRHFFGGIEPSNMTAFSAYIENGVVKINAQLPGDTVVNGQTLCSIAGAVIRRKVSDYPVDEFDGDKIADISESSVLTDIEADPAGTYHYAAFPYTTQGVYSTSPNSRSAVNLPDPMVTFTTSMTWDVGLGKRATKITAALPENAVGAVIRKSTKGYPTRETEGEEVTTITSDGVYLDTDVEVGYSYYYSAFTYNHLGVYNRGGESIARVDVRPYEYLYGYDLDTTDSDPDTRVSYPSDVDNRDYASAYMDTSASTFNYGGWNITPGEGFMPKPCMLKTDGTVDYYLNPNDYTKREDGVTASDVANTSYSGNAMMEWPKIYTKRWEDEDGVYHFRCSDGKVGDDWDCWCNYDVNDNVVDHFYTSIYLGSLDSSNVMRSLSGCTIKVSLDQSTGKTYVSKNGNNWSDICLAEILLIQDLLVMMGKSTNCQDIYGRGDTSITAYHTSTGRLNTRGLFFGNTSAVKVFGMEDFWGYHHKSVMGMVIPSNAYKVKITPGTHDGSTTVGFNTNGSGYINIGVTITSPSSNNRGFVSKMSTFDYGRLPIAFAGSSTTYEGDGVYVMNSSSTRIPGNGGCYGNTNVPDSAGPFAWQMNNHTTEKYMAYSIAYRPVAN